MAVYMVMVKPKNDPDRNWVSLTGIEYESKYEAEQELEYEMTVRGEDYWDGMVMTIEQEEEHDN